MTQERKAYIERHARLAMEQMEKYGVPASVTLAQACLESGDGSSELAIEHNAHFGIKGSYNGRYAIHDDDAKGERFRSYQSVEASYEDHSRLVSGYPACRGLAADDYLGWTHGIVESGYATDGNYLSKVLGLIEANDLARYDRMVMRGLSAGASASYSMPVGKGGDIVVTSPFGARERPSPGASASHAGVDIRADHVPVYATEDGGRVVHVGFDPKGGNTVRVRYVNWDGSATVCSYLHLSRTEVREGDTVNAGDELAVGGNTGESTAPHLHFGVERVDPGGRTVRADPLEYLAWVRDRGDIPVRALSKDGMEGDILSRYAVGPGEGGAAAVSPMRWDVGEGMSAGEWPERRFPSWDGGIGQVGPDPMFDLIADVFSALVALAGAVDGMSGAGEWMAPGDSGEGRQAGMPVEATDRRAGLGGDGETVAPAHDGMSRSPGTGAPLDIQGGLSAGDMSSSIFEGLLPGRGRGRGLSV